MACYPAILCYCFLPRLCFVHKDLIASLAHLWSVGLHGGTPVSNLSDKRAFTKQFGTLSYYKASAKSWALLNVILKPKPRISVLEKVRTKFFFIRSGSCFVFFYLNFVFFSRSFYSSWMHLNKEMNNYVNFFPPIFLPQRGPRTVLQDKNFNDHET